MRPLKDHAAGRVRRFTDRMRSDFRAYLEDEMGGVIVFLIPFFLLLVLAGGMAIDFMHHETLRAKTQDALDRGVLAATNLNQTLDPEATVREYFKSATLPDDIDIQVTVGSDSETEKRITATASLTMNTVFLNLAGISSLDVNVVSAAEQKRKPIEVALVLDISGSMRNFTTDETGLRTEKINVLREAAQSFVNKVLTEEGKKATTISLVPYAGQVNVAPIFDDYIIDPDTVHTASSCIEVLEDAELANTSLPSAAFVREQVPHFHYWDTDPFYMEWGWCPSDDASIVVLSNDPGTINDQIRNMPLHDGTGTHYAMKWALALLDPTSNGRIGDLASPGFENRPLPWNDDTVDELERSKVIVLMTDGMIVPQMRPSTEVMNNPGQLQRLARGNALEDELIRQPNGWRRTRRSERANNDDFDALCQLAEANNVRVFTIGFDVTTRTDLTTQLRDCATFDSDFYNAEGTTIKSAFDSIAGQIQQLKLIN